MASKVVRDKVDAYFAANWSATPIVDIDNTPDDTPRTNLDPWIALQYPWSEESQKSVNSIGNRVWREEGNIQIHIQVASGSGNAAYLTLSDSVQSLLRGVNIDGVVIRSIAPAAAREDVKAFQGNWYSLTIEAEYYHDQIA